MWTNSKTVVRNYGAALDLRYILTKHFTLQANGSCQALKKTNQNDGLEDGFNTPEWMGNAGISAANIFKGLGFSLHVKYQSNYYWQSFLINGNVPAVFNADAMVSYTFAKAPLDIKMGATNIINHYYYSILGGPQIGGFYYTTITYSFR